MRNASKTQQERVEYLEYRLEIERIKNKNGEVATVVMIVAAICILLIGVMVFLSQPVNVQGSCTVAQWKEMPDQLSFGGLRMLPDNAHCDFTVQGPAWLVLRHG